jgi:type VI secretion system protein ImpJ
MGQALLPEHFYAQEQSLRAESTLRFGMSTTPAWGLGRLVWDKFQLPNGALQIKSLALVLESGLVLDIPGNAAPVFLDLKNAGASTLTIFVQLKSKPEIVASRSGDPNEEGIQRILQTLELSTTQSSAEERFKLCKVACSADGKWSFQEDYVPPLLRVRRDMLFDGPLGRMEQLVKALRQLLKAELQENHLSGETQLLAKQALRSTFSFHTALIDLDAQVHPHPYHLFVALRTLYLDLSVLRNAPLDAIDHVYDHQDLAGSFSAFLKPLETMLLLGRPEVPYVEFSRKDGQFACDFDKDVKRAKDIFLLIQRPEVTSSLDLGSVKLSSPSRIGLVHERALTGIPFSRVDRPPFAQTLASTVDIYAISRGQEWDYAVAEGRLVLFDGPELSGCRLYLHCRPS